MKWFDGDDLAVVGVIVIAIASLLFLKDATQIVLVCVGGLVGVAGVLGGLVLLRRKIA